MNDRGYRNRSAHGHGGPGQQHSNPRPLPFSGTRSFALRCQREAYFARDRVESFFLLFSPSANGRVEGGVAPPSSLMRTVSPLGNVTIS
jgi:hypothetical protein